MTGLTKHYDILFLYLNWKRTSSILVTKTGYPAVVAVGGAVVVVVVVLVVEVVIVDGGVGFPVCPGQKPQDLLQYSIMKSVARTH